MQKTGLLLYLLAASCKKDKLPVRCYECEMTYSTGLPAGTQFPCTSNIEVWQQQQKDNNGNAIRSTCKEQ